MKKQTKKSIILLPVILFLTAYAAVPGKVTVKQGQEINFRFGITAQASTKTTGKFTCCAKLFNFIPIKTVNVSVTPQFYVVPSGQAIGVRVHSDGVLVVGIGEVHGSDGKNYKPAKCAGINVGDRITAVNGEKITTSGAFSKKLNESPKTATLTIVRNENIITVSAEPVYSAEGDCRRMGLWVKDSAAGIGTLTFYNPENSTFGALGHAICDSDTGEIMTVNRGSVSACSVSGVLKGTSGAPGELIGSFSNCELGSISSNCEIGIYGAADSVPDDKRVAVASRFQVKEGKAQVLCDVDGNGAKAYDIEITKVSTSSRISNKCFVLKITDRRLIDKTGGIVQGMSGAPILQNNMLIGAITHVFVNDPKRGYGIFAENMLDMTMRVK